MRGTNRAYNAFADSRDDRLFSCATDEPIKMRAYCDSRFDLYADSILRNAVDRGSTSGRIRGVNDFGINTCAHRLQNCLASTFGGKIDCACPVEVERYASFICRDQGKDDVAYVTACKVMC